jgi:hypothetical protein|tara:strand:+ start:60 stop:470 length:411 start_codon:yes stop_codon:yes gene_type:complete
MKKLIIIALTLMFASCSSTYDISTDYRIKSILTITEAGDTLAVPVRDFKFRILDRRIQEIIDRDPFRYQYRRNWQNWNYNSYPIPSYNQGYNYNRPKPNVKPNIKPFNPPAIIKPLNIPSIKPIVKPTQNKKNERK